MLGAPTYAARRRERRRVARRGSPTFRDQYAELMRSALLVDLQYRASIVIWLIWGSPSRSFTLAIWWSIAAAGSVAGSRAGDFAQYFFGVMLVNQATLPGTSGTSIAGSARAR